MGADVLGDLCPRGSCPSTIGLSRTDNTSFPSILSNFCFILAHLPLMYDIKIDTKNVGNIGRDVIDSFRVL